MKIYRAIRKGDEPLKKFIPPKNSHKLEGYYFAPSKEVAERWGVTLFRKGNFDIVEFEVAYNTPVIVAYDGFYWERGREWIEACKYKTGLLCEFLHDEKFVQGYKIEFFKGNFLEIPTLPEIIIKKLPKK